jgi:hypothetical protein
VFFRKKTKPFKSPDGQTWKVDVTAVGASNAMVRYMQPDSRVNRYAWYLTAGPTARSVTARLEPNAVLDSLSDEDIARLYRRSMPVSAGGTPLVTAT